MNRTVRSTVVLGVGNLILSDDGLGITALRLLEQDRRVPPGTLLVDGGTFGVELLPYVEGASRLVILDAVDAGVPPGTLVRVSGDQIEGFPGARSVHDIGFPDLLAALRLLGKEPSEILLRGIQPATTGIGTTLSPIVEQAMPQLIEATIDFLRREFHSAVVGRNQSR